jgi:hypothetical protein
MGKELSKRHTHPGLTKLLLTILLEWKTRTPRTALRFMHDNLKELQASQDDIWWDKLMVGNIYILWQEIQIHYFLDIGKQNPGLCWTSALMQKITQMAWDQWDHRNAILNNSDNLITQAEAVMISS